MFLPINLYSHILNDTVVAVTLKGHMSTLCADCKQRFK
jgi:hypothetical protein